MISKAVQRSPPKVTAAAIDHKLINAIIQAEIAHKNTPCQLDRNTQLTGSVRCYEFNDRLLCGGEFHSAFSLFVASTPYFPIPQSIEPPTFSPHYALLLAQGKAVGDHGDEFGIGRLALDEAAASIRFCCFDTKKICCIVSCFEHSLSVGISDL